MVITRFAPSNTGKLHLGSVRTALFAYAWAKRNNGICYLRIEDTDKSRSTKDNLINIMNGMEWLGIKFDHGPNISDIMNDKYDQKFFQSKREDIYQANIEKMLSAQNAYKKDGAVWVDMSKVGVGEIQDEILGTVKIPPDQNKDFVIRKSDGQPLFHIAVVSDDAEYGVTIVIRGQDHLLNTFKHVAIQNALGIPVPKYAHIPLILDENGQKLSKRRTDQRVVIDDFINDGYLPEATINYACTLGWSPGANIDKFDKEHLFQTFDIKKVKKTNARADLKRLDHINSLWLREKSNDFIYDSAKRIPSGSSCDKMSLKIIESLKSYAKNIKELIEIMSNMNHSGFFETDAGKAVGSVSDDREIRMLLSNYCKSNGIKFKTFCSELSKKMCGNENIPIEILIKLTRLEQT